MEENVTDQNFDQSAKNWIKGQELRIEHLKANIDNDTIMLELHNKSLCLLKETLKHEEKCLEDYKDFLSKGLQHEIINIYSDDNQD